MQVILLQDIKSLGRRGDVKNVKDGYARNYLIPQGLAKLATPDSVKVIETQKTESLEQTEELRSALKKVESETAKNPLKFDIKVGEKGGVFGSVGANDIKAAIIREYPAIGNHLEVKKDHIRELGVQKVQIDLGQGIDGEISIDIGGEGA